MLGELFGLFYTFWQDFMQSSPVQKTGFLITLGTPLTAIMAFILQRYRLQNVEKQQLDKLCKIRAKQITKLEHDNDQLSAEINNLKSWCLDVRLKEVEKERKDGNEERAITLLRTGIEAIRPDLASCCLELASHYLSLLPDYGERNLVEAERLARISTLLHPSDQEARLLLADILATESGIEYDRSNPQSADALWDEAVDFLNISDKQEAIVELLKAAQHYVSQGQYRIAERIARRALLMSERNLSSDEYISLVLRNLQAYCLGASGSYGKALELFKALLLDQERVNGMDHPNTLVTRNNIASQTGNAGDAEQALELVKALLPDQERVIGKDHPDTLATRNNIASWTGRAGDVEQALELFKALLSDQERVIGKDHLETLKTRNNIATWTGGTGDAEQALELFKALLSDQERVIGKDHPDTLTIRNNIAVCTEGTGDTEQSLELFKALLQDQIEVIGKDHPQTLNTLKQIEHWQSRVDDN